jgi:hypothetical protein
MTDVRSVKLPWGPEGEFTANCAIGSVRESMLLWLKNERGIHAETLLSAIGSLCGFAAQTAVWHTSFRAGKKSIPENGMVVVQTKSGEIFIFGDEINGYLAPQAGNEFPLWIFVAAAAVQAGVPLSELPDLNAIFARVAGTIGTPDGMKPQVPPDHQPGLMPRQVLELLWLRVLALLQYTGNPGPGKGKSVAPEHWPVVLAVVAQQLLTSCKDVLDPRLGTQLIMESAVIASKFDPNKLNMQPAPPIPAR